MRELKPCPFCGADAILINSRLSGTAKPVFYVECVSCNCMMGSRRMVILGNKGKGYFETREDAIEAWNRRYVHEQ